MISESNANSKSNSSNETELDFEKAIEATGFDLWNGAHKIGFIQKLLDRIDLFEHSQINIYLEPKLQRDFISLLPSNYFSSFWWVRLCSRFGFLFRSEKGLDHIAEYILSYLDEKSLCSAELVCKEWHRVISDGMLWKKLIESRVRVDSLWKGLSQRRGWWVSLKTNSVVI